MRSVDQANKRPDPPPIKPPPPYQPPKPPPPPPQPPPRPRPEAKTRKFAFLFGLLLFAALPAKAQGYPTWEFYGGFSYANVDLGDPQNLFGRQISQNFLGGEFSFSFSLHKNLRLLLVDFGFQWQKSDILVAGARATDVGTYQALFGPEFTLRGEKATVFLRALVGAAGSQLRLRRALFPGGPFPEVTRQDGFALGFGGGVDVNWSDRFAVRLFQADYVPARFGGAWQDGFRLGVGVVIKFGGG